MEQEILKAPDLSKDVIMRRMHRVRMHPCVRRQRPPLANVLPESSSRLPVLASKQPDNLP